MFGIDQGAGNRKARSTDGIWQRLRRLLLGRRFIDLPIRAIALLLVLTAFMPGATESDDPLYLTLFWGSQALILTATFFPGWSTIAGVTLYLVHLVLFPGYLNSFEESLYFSAAVLIAFGRWRAWGVLAITTLGLAWISLLPQPDVAELLSLSGIALGFGAALGLSAWGLERRIHTEVSHREQAAIAHEQETQRLRVQFAVDTHDTISHSLATQAAIVRVLSRETDNPQARAALSELAMVNEAAQQDLRTLLSRLRSLGEPDTPTTTPRDEFTQTIESLVRAADAGGITVSADVSGLPDHVDIALAEQISFLARELVTNMVKHSSASTGCFLAVWAHADEPRAAVTIAASNPTDESTVGLPRTLSARVKALGGNIITEQESGRFSIALKLPACATSGSISPEQGMLAR